MELLMTVSRLDNQTYVIYENPFNSTILHCAIVHLLFENLRVMFELFESLMFEILRCRYLMQSRLLEARV